MFYPESIHACIAFEAIQEMLETGSVSHVKSKEIPDDLKERRACFVTIKNSDNSLRGCIGTLSPSYSNLMLEIINNAVSSALNDSRFDSLKVTELQNIKICVEVLDNPKDIQSISELNPEKYGIIVYDKRRRGVLLPGIESIDTVEKQIRIAKNKAGIYDFEENYKIKKFTSTKYR